MQFVLIICICTILEQDEQRGRSRTESEQSEGYVCQLTAEPKPGYLQLSQTPPPPRFVAGWRQTHPSENLTKILKLVFSGTHHQKRPPELKTRDLVSAVKICEKILVQVQETEGRLVSTCLSSSRVRVES